MMFREQEQDFLTNLKSLTSEFVAAAQKIYDDWDEHPDVYFGGGICHLIADAFVEIIYKHHPNYTASTFTRDDIQHVETIVYNIDSDSLYIVLSQSGETKDVHRAMELIQKRNGVIVAVVNVVESLIAREALCGVYINANNSAVWSIV